MKGASCGLRPTAHSSRPESGVWWPSADGGELQALRVGGLLVAAALLVIPGCRPPGRGPAWERWGITRPARDSTVERRLAQAHELFYARKYTDALLEYQEALQADSTCAEAWLGLSMVHRYSGDLEPALAECRRALELDPAAVAALCNLGDLMSPLRRVPLSESLPDEERLEQSRQAYERAARSPHRLAGYAHLGLLVNRLQAGKLTPARQALAALGRLRYFPEKLEDFAYNVLVSLPESAIVFVSGDNDCYPLMVLQEAQGFRRDVRVVSAGLLSEWRVAALYRDSLNVPLVYSDSEVMHMQPVMDTVLRKLLLRADWIIARVILDAARQARPVYFANTLSPAIQACYSNRLILEGLVTQVAEREVKSCEPGIICDSADSEKILRGVNETYRLARFGERVSWPANLSPLTRDLSAFDLHYLALYGRIADIYTARGDTVQAVATCRRIVELGADIAPPMWLATVLDHWLRLQPRDSTARALRPRYPSALLPPE